MGSGWHTAVALFLLALLALPAASAQDATNATVYRYPLVADGAQCTVPNKLFNSAIQAQIFTGAAYLVAQGATVFNVSQACVDATLSATAVGCQNDLLVQDGCCSAACAAGWKSIDDNPATAECLEVAIFKICAGITANRFPAGAPVAALPAMYLTVAGMRRRCITGRDYLCPAIIGYGEPPGAQVPPPPAVAATPPAVRPVAPNPAPTPLPSTTPTPSTQPAPAPAVSTTTTPPTETESKSNTAAIVGGVVGGVAGLALIGLVAWVFVSRSKKQEAAAALVPAASKDETQTGTGSATGASGGGFGPAMNPAYNNNDGEVSVVISKSEKRSSTPGENNSQQHTMVTVTAASDKSGTAQSSHAAPGSVVNAPESETNTGQMATQGGVSITQLQQGPGSQLTQTGTGFLGPPSATSAGASAHGRPPSYAGSAYARRNTPFGATSGGLGSPQGYGGGFRSDDDASFHPPATPAPSWQSGIGSGRKPLGSLPVLSPEEENAYQRGALNRMQIPWSTIKVGRELGVGGFGSVYKGQWQGNTVAVKMLKVKEITPTQRIELRREALAMFEKPHPCVATIYGMVDEEERCALVMRYYRNGSVSEVFKNGKYETVSELSRLKYALQVATGMCCLHERNMIHGDLKTGNLLMSDDMESVVITDFGLAGIQGQAVSSGALTVHISPPEVLQNPKAPRTQSCDVYAFGIVMLELLLGRYAFMNMARDAIKSVVVSGSRPVIPPQVPPELADIIRACWAQKPEDRPTFPDVLVRLDSAMGVIGGPQATTLSWETTREWP